MNETGRRGTCIQHKCPSPLARRQWFVNPNSGERVCAFL
jgi:hypothetical protein